MSTQVAPDVDLKSRGIPWQVVVGGFVTLLVVAILGHQASARDTDDEDETGFPFWQLWLLLWGVVRLMQLLLALVFMFLIILVVRQRSILYVPTPPGTQRSPGNNPYNLRSPASWKMPFEDVWVATEDGTRIHGWLVYQPPDDWQGDEAPFTFVYFHGNAGNIGHRLENIRDMHQRLRVNVLIIDYRGYGNSEDGPGPSESGFMMDAIGTYRWIIDRINNPVRNQVVKMRADRILLFGRSIGGAVAIRLFAHLLKEQLEQKRRAEDLSLPLPAGLVLENTFTSLRDMAVQVFPFLRFLSFLLRPPLIFDEWKGADGLKFVTRHLDHWCCCLLSGLQDEIVPPIQMRQLHGILKEARPKVLKFFVFQHGGHNDTPTRGGEDYWKSFRRYMELVSESEGDRRQGRAELQLR